jgi:hypothetical protein
MYCTPEGEFPKGTPLRVFARRARSFACADGPDKQWRGAPAGVTIRPMAAWSQIGRDRLVKRRKGPPVFIWPGAAYFIIAVLVGMIVSRVLQLWGP